MVEPVFEGLVSGLVVGHDLGYVGDASSRKEPKARAVNFHRNAIPKRPEGDDLALPCIPEGFLPCYRVLSLPITPGCLHLCNNQTVANVLANYA